MAVVMSAQPEIDDHIAFSSARSQLSTSESRASNEVRKADPVEEHEESESAPSCGSSEETMVWHWVLRLLRRRDEFATHVGSALAGDSARGSGGGPHGSAGTAAHASDEIRRRQIGA